MRLIKVLWLILFLLQVKYKSQNITTDYICTYNLEYKINGKNQTEQFIMFMNVNDEKSYFLSTNNYVIDTANISEPLKLASYESDFNERIIITKNKILALEKINEVNLSYEESYDLNWQILDKTKKTENVKMQLAKTKAYGRIWYAWFSRDIPVNFGPYKFKGLPGFIVALFDEESNFVFTLQKFKKKKKTLQLPNKKKYKVVNKKDFNKTRFKIQTADDGVVIFENPKDRIDWQKNLEKRYKNLPLLDIQFPIK